MNILEVNNLSKSFGNKLIIKNISFSIKEGEVVGFVGPNGSGKTTTLKLLTNLIYPDSGTIVINSYNLLKSREKALSNVSGIIENPGVYSYLTGRENLEFIRKINCKTKEKMNSIIDYIGLSSRIDDTVKKYSLGMKQRLALGMSILCEPKLLILDEPTNGLDPTGTMEFRNLITKLSQETKVSVLISSHLLNEIDKICNSIIFIKQGELVSFKDNKNKNDLLYKARISNSTTISSILKNLDYILNISMQNENEILFKIKNGRLHDMLSLLAENEIKLIDIEKINSTTEFEYSRLYNNKEL